MNKGFTFFLLAFCLLFHACTKQAEVQPNEDAQANAPIAHFWQHTSDQSLVSTTVSTLKTMDVADAFEKYVSKFGRPLWDSSLTSLSPGGKSPSSIIIPIIHRYKQYTNAAILGAYVGDKLQYRLVYRYYMPKELIQTADDKNRWESLFLAFDKQLFNRGQSSGFHRQEEARSGKGNANARYIEIAYTYCSTTYVVDSEGVPISASYTTCNTQYIYQWLDDAPVYTPPTPTDPGNGYVPVTPPPTGGGGGGTTAPVSTLLVVAGQDKSPITLAQFIKCFGALTAGSTYKITVYVEEPNPGSGDEKVGANVGHTFIGLTKITNGQEITQYVGFYPYSRTLSYPTASKMVNNGQSGYTVTTSYNVTNTNFQNAINSAVSNSTKQYDISAYNCTNYALDICNSAGISLPRTPATFPYGYGQGLSPGNLGLDLKNMKSSNPSANTNINTQGGTSNASKGPC